MPESGQFSRMAKAGYSHRPPPTWRWLSLFALLTSSAIASVESVSFRHIDASNGLPQSTVPALAQDAQGLIWIASFDGLHRYDGYRFESYRNDPRLPDSLTDNLINTLLVDQGNRLWIGTAQGGLNRLDLTPTGTNALALNHSAESSAAAHMQHYLPGTGRLALPHRRVMALFEDGQARLWVGTGQGLALYLPAEDGFKSYSHNPLDDHSAPAGGVTALAQAEGGKLWVGTGTGLSRFDPESEQFQSWPLPGNIPATINSLYVDSDGSLWLGTTQRGLWHLAVGAQQFQIYSHDPHEPVSLSHNDVRAIQRDRSGRLWVATEGGGLARMAEDGNGFESFRRNTADGHSLSLDDVWSLFEDRTGLLWIGTAGGGINTTLPERNGVGRLMHAPYDKQTLSDPFVWGLSKDSQNNVWVATLQGLDKIAPATGAVQRYTQFNTRFKQTDGVVINPRVQSLYVDGQDRIWFGTLDGLLAVFDPATEQTRLISHPARPSGRFSEHRVLMIEGDSSGRIWVGCFEYLVEIDARELKVLSTRVTGEDELPAAFVRVMTEQKRVEQKSGAELPLWFGTHGAGLQRLDRSSGQVQSYSHKRDDAKSLSNDVVRALHWGDDGTLWIGTMNGLNRWRADRLRAGDAQFESWFERDGLPNSTIYGILPGEGDKIWLSTNAGISEFDPGEQRFRNFNWDDGLPSVEFNGLAQVRTDDGRLWFGGTTGLAVIDPARLRMLPASSAALIASLQVRNPQQGVRFKAGVAELSAEQNDLTFTFAAADYRDAKRNQFQWRLQGFHPEWAAIGTRNDVSFTNLDPGHYELQIQHANADGVWSKNPTNLPFQILPAWYETWWARGLYGALLISVAYWLWRSHKRKLREQERVAERLRRNDKLKDEFLANTSHELRTPLNGIIGVAESLRDGIAGQLNDHARDHLGLIADSGRRLAQLVNEILDFKKLTHSQVVLDRSAVDLAASVNVVLALSQPLLGSKQVALINALASDLPPVDADENRLEQILHNLIGNAIKFTEQGTISVSAKLRPQETAQGEHNVLEICVADTGCGIDAEQLERVFLPFEQVEDSNTRHHGGTGLGLAVVKKLVEMHGGKIQVHSQPGQGSQFIFYLPLANAGLALKQPQQKLTAPARVVPIKRTNVRVNAQVGGLILIADDEPLNCQVVADCLSLQGYQVACAYDGQAALEAMQTQSFALLILDVMMPKLSGYDVTRQVRIDYTAQELPILLLSAKNRPEDIAAGLSAGANDYIGKPIERSELLARVRNLMALHEVNAAKREREQARLVQESVKRLARYFPPALVRRLLTDPDPQPLQAERRRVTVLFADMVEFTALTDRFEPEIITDLLNQFVGGMGALIEKFDGTLNELLGDGMVVLFGAPEQMAKEAQAEHAVAVAVAMQKEMQRLKTHWLEAGIDHNIDLRIGIHQDFVTVGNFGSGNVLAYRAVGSGVNLAARLQALCTPGRVLVSYPVYALTRERYHFGELREEQIKGFKHPHRIVELDPDKARDVQLMDLTKIISTKIVPEAPGS